MIWKLEKFSDRSGQWYQYEGRAYSSTIEREGRHYRWGVWLRNCPHSRAWDKALAGGECSSLKSAKRNAGIAIWNFLAKEMEEVYK